MNKSLIMKQNICNSNLILKNWWSLERIVYETNEDDNIQTTFQNILNEFNELFPGENIKIEDIIEFNNMDNTLENENLAIHQKNIEIFTKLFNENDDKNVIRRYIADGLSICKIIQNKNFDGIIYITVNNKINGSSIYTLKKYFNAI